MDWYYAEGKERRGPVAESEFRALIAAGKITAGTLVWNATMTEWQRADVCGAMSAPLAPGTQVCIVTGKTYPTSAMIETEHGWVSAEGRDTYYQSLREGVPLPAAAGQTNARADGKRVVVPVQGARLPMRCVKTNEPVAASDMQTKTLYWCSPFVALAALLNLLIVLILYLVLRKKVVLDIPATPAARRKTRQHGFIALGIALLGVAAFVLPFFAPRGAIYAFIPLGIVLLLGAAIWSVRRGTLLRVTKIKNGYAWLAGATPEFVSSLPAYRP